MFIPTTIVIIQELDVTWAQMEFDHNPHPSTGVKMIGASDELIETLEDNQVKLHTCISFLSHKKIYMHTSRYIIIPVSIAKKISLE